MRYGKRLVRYVLDYYRDKYNMIIIGTGNRSYVVNFYEKCGFIFSHVVKDFFADNYDRPIFEEGKRIVNMVCLSRNL